MPAVSPAKFPSFRASSQFPPLLVEEEHASVSPCSAHQDSDATEDQQDEHSSADLCKVISWVKKFFFFFLVSLQIKKGAWLYCDLRL